MANVSSSAASAMAFKDVFDLSGKSGASVHERPIGSRTWIAQMKNEESQRDMSIVDGDSPGQQTKSTQHDLRNMQRMGHKQQLVVGLIDIDLPREAHCCSEKFQAVVNNLIRCHCDRKSGADRLVCVLTSLR
jgi:hypothetical protein